jgi:long-chain acyl-CoA synthetase
MFLRRAVLPAVPSALVEAPTYGADLIPTTYATVQARRTALGSALLALERSGRLRSHKIPASEVSPPEITHPGVPHFGASNRVKNGARRGWAVGLWSQNREEWQVVDLACHAYGLVSVSLYETLGPDVAQFM